MTHTGWKPTAVQSIGTSDCLTPVTSEEPQNEVAHKKGNYIVQ